jgi:hypothetical protein
VRPFLRFISTQLHAIIAEQRSAGQKQLDALEQHIASIRPQQLTDAEKSDLAFPFSYESICATILEKLSFLFALAPTAVIDAFESGGGAADSSEDADGGVGAGAQKTAGMAFIAALHSRPNEALPFHIRH